MKITTLVENEAPKDTGLEARFGLGLHVEVAGKRILFDCGPDNAFVVNAKQLGIDLTAVDAFILSHAHYDHGAGLEHFLQLNPRAPVYLLPAATGRYFSTAPEAALRYIGLQTDLFERYRERFLFLERDTQLFDCLHILQVERCAEFRPRANGNLLREVASGEMVPDDFRHELMVALRVPRGLVLLTGCAHNGITSMVGTAAQRLAEVPILAVVGGFHLASPRTRAMTESRETVEGIGQFLLKAGVGAVYTGHCTGEEACRVLRDVLGARLKDLHTGTVIDLAAS
jgi:7,8-dihydropterin-6-yl-methyl-4-(beta-D-ribofuranosyl)aminobenzene 5'-phosphate synthase